MVNADAAREVYTRHERNTVQLFRDNSETDSTNSLRALDKSGFCISCASRSEGAARKLFVALVLSAAPE